MATTTITMVKGDTAPPLSVVLSNADGVQDLTGATVDIRIEAKGVNGSTFEDDCTVDADPTTGAITYDWGDGTPTSTVGKYDVEFRATYADATVQTFPTLKTDKILLVVREPFASEA